MISWKKKAGLIIAFGLFGMAPQVAPAQVTVQLYDLVFISGGRVVLSEIADLKGDSLAVSQLKSLQIGSTMRRTESRTVTPEEIRRALPPGVEAYFSGAPAVEVRPRALPGEYCDFRPAILRHFARLAGDSIQVAVAGVKSKEILEACNSPLVQYSIISEGLLTPGRQVVSLARLDAAGVTSRHHLDVELSLFGRLAFAARKIQRGQVIQAQDLIVRTADLKETGLSGLIYESERILGWEAARTISRDAPLRWDQVRPPATVRKGDGVELIVASGNVQVKTQATALETGAPGEFIWVRLDENGKRMRVKVVEGGFCILE